MKLFNTLTRKVEEFKPINPPQVGMYTCGPTVYDFMHIGNLRTFVFSDILCRALKAEGYKVKLIQNITDIDDKIIKKAKEQDVTVDQLTEQYTRAFLQDTDKLNIIPADVYPKATEHIEGMIKYTKALLEKGLAYEKDGSVYFDISEFPEYGKLSGVEGRTLKSGTRILSDEYTKDDIQDFALWKAVDGDEFGYDSPWGKGRPGWHIECSVMSQQYLGDTFDIHAGGVDLIFPHHENEIVQSEGKTGKPFVNFFIHGEHILIDGAKMSKSLKNFYTLKDLEEKGFEPLALRYLFLTAHYRDKLNFTWESLTAAQNTLNKIREEIRAWGQPEGEVGEFWQKFLAAAKKDLNLPQAVAVLHQMLNSDTPTSSRSRDLLEMDKILGLGLDQYLATIKYEPYKLPVSGLVGLSSVNIGGGTITQLDQRELARQRGDFELSDKYRQDIEKKEGVILIDTSDGPMLQKKK